MAKNSLPPFEESGASNGVAAKRLSEADEVPAEPVWDESAGEFSSPVVLPITDVLDLHTVSPHDAQGVTEEYLHECYRLNRTAIRIIHGRGIGVQRAMVRKILENTEFVVDFRDAPLEAGGWGATLVTLRKCNAP